MVKFAELEQKNILNSFLQHNENGQREKNVEEKNEIEYIPTNTKHLIKDYIFLNTINTGSDYRLVRCKKILNNKMEIKKLLQNSNKGDCIICLEKREEEFHLENKTVSLYSTEEDQDITVMTKKLTNTLHESAKKIVDEVQV